MAISLTAKAGQDGNALKRINYKGDKMEIKITGTPDEIAQVIGLCAEINTPGMRRVLRDRLNEQPITVTYTTESTDVSLGTSPAYTADQIQRISNQHRNTCRNG